MSHGALRTGQSLTVSAWALLEGEPTGGGRTVIAQRGTRESAAGPDGARPTAVDVQVLDRATKRLHESGRFDNCLILIAKNPGVGKRYVVPSLVGVCG